MVEEDRTAVCGVRYARWPRRVASCVGTVSSEVVLGGRKVAIRRPRVRADGHEVVLPTFRTMADADPLNRRVVEQMLVGVATRQACAAAAGSRVEDSGISVATAAIRAPVSRSAAPAEKVIDAVACGLGAAVLWQLVRRAARFLSTVPRDAQ